VGDPAYDGGTLLKSLAPSLLGAADLPGAARHALALFAEAAGLDHDRLRRWAQLHAVQAAFWARRHGFRRARGGPHLETLTRLADHLAESLTA